MGVVLKERVTRSIKEFTASKTSTLIRFWTLTILTAATTAFFKSVTDIAMAWISPAFQTRLTSSSPGIIATVVVVLEFIWYHVDHVFVGVTILLIVVSSKTVSYLRRTVCQESVTFIVALGVQIVQWNALGNRVCIKFIPTKKIRTLIIHEIIRRQAVVSYLAILLKTPDKSGSKIVPLFPSILPRLQFLRKVYCESYPNLHLKV